LSLRYVFLEKEDFDVGTLLMNALGRESRRGRLAVVNVDSSSSVALNFLAGLSFRNSAGQYEMILEL
jgi:hypothetical protein